MTSPTFFLFGEPPQAAADGFLHLEPLDTRSRPANWNIRSHRHDDLHHVFALASGSGEMTVEGRRMEFRAPCLLLIPAGSVHAFHYALETTGQVLTLAASLMQELAAREAAFAGLFDVGVALPAGPEAAALADSLGRLARELAWRAPGHAAAVEASLLQILVTALRLKARDAHDLGADNDADGRLVARFREQVEVRFRAHPSIEVYAQALGVSLSRLRMACRRLDCGSPLDMVHARQILEAKRALLYSHMSVAEIGRSLGFDDTAYFVRLFRRRTGLAPGQFRVQRSTQPVLGAD